MGLDSVELLVSFENEFGIEVPDLDAEHMSTVGDVATWFFGHMSIKKLNNTTKLVLAKKILGSLERIGVNNNIKLDEPMSNFFPKENLSLVWEEFTKELGLKTPKLNRLDLGQKKSANLISKIFQRNRPALLSHNFERLIEWVGALNYRQFVDPKNVASLFDVTIVVMYLTSSR